MEKNRKKISLWLFPSMLKKNFLEYNLVIFSNINAVYENIKHRYSILERIFMIMY